MSEQRIYIGADHDVTYSGAVPAAGGSYLNAGTCTWRLLDDAGAVVTSTGTGAATGTLGYVAASNGNYLGVIDATFTALLTNGSLYYVEVTFKQGLYDDARRLPRTARYRQET